MLNLIVSICLLVLSSAGVGPAADGRGGEARLPVLHTPQVPATLSTANIRHQVRLQVNPEKTKTKIISQETRILPPLHSICFAHLLVLLCLELVGGTLSSSSLNFLMHFSALGCSLLSVIVIKGIWSDIFCWCCSDQASFQTNVIPIPFNWFDVSIG